MPKISRLAFKKWEKENKDDLISNYRDYLKNSVLGDKNFELENTEDYWTWAEEEYQIELENKV